MSADAIGVEEREGRGRCVVAWRALTPGERVDAVSGAAYAAVPLGSFRPSLCARCFQPAAEQCKLSRCSGCRQARYCSAVCQRADWALHRHECPHLSEEYSALHSLDEGTLVQLLLAARCLQRRAQGKGDEADRCFDELYAVDPDAESIELAHKAVRLAGLFPKTIAAATVARLLVASRLNSFGVLNALHSVVGAACHPMAALLNHSCAPNCILAWEGSTLCVCTVRNVAPGEELCHAFVDLAMPTPQRQEALRHRYGFQCECERCTLPAGAKVDRMLEARPPDGTPAASAILESEKWLRAAQVETDDNRARELVLRALNIRRLLCTPQSCLRHAAEMEAFGRNLEAGEIHAARECCSNVVAFLQSALSHVPHHPLLALQRHTLADLHAACGEVEEAKSALELAVASMSVCPGRKHSSLCRRACDRLDELKSMLQ